MAKAWIIASATSINCYVSFVYFVCNKAHTRHIFLYTPATVVKLTNNTNRLQSRREQTFNEMLLCAAWRGRHPDVEPKVHTHTDYGAEHVTCMALHTNSRNVNVIESHNRFLNVLTYATHRTECWRYDTVTNTGCFTTSGHNCRRWFPRFLWSKKFI